MITCCTDGLTCQVEVLQWSLRSHCSAEFRAESGEAMIRSVNFTFGGSDIECVCDGGSSIDILNLHTHTKYRYVNIQILITAHICSEIQI